jgi:hypothetical protein
MIKRDLLPNIMTMVGYAVAALFVILGFFMVFSPQVKNVLPTDFRNIFGFVMIGYGLLRTVVIFSKSKQRKEEEDETDF